MEQSPLVFITAHAHQLLIIFDIIGIIIGIISIITIRKTSKMLGGRVAGALSLFTWGVVAMVLAFAWTLFFSRLQLWTAPLDVHHILMTIGMILFVLAARRFSSLIIG